MQENRFLCPLTNKSITSLECFDICMVMEEMAPVYTIDENVAPIITDETKKKCMECNYHCE